MLGFGSPVIVNWSDVHDSGAPGPQPKARMKTTAVASATGASTAVLYRMPNCTALTRKGGDDTSSGEMPGGANGQWYIAINRQGGSRTGVQATQVLPRGGSARKASKGHEPGCTASPVQCQCNRRKAGYVREDGAVMLSERQRSSARDGGMEPGMVRKDRAPQRGSRMAVVPLPTEQSVGRYPKGHTEKVATRIPC